MSFGEINVTDEGVLGITIELTNNRQLFWEVGIVMHENKVIYELVKAYNNIQIELEK